MGLELYGRKDSINVQKVMWLLGELGVEYTQIEKGGDFGGLDDEDFQALTPFGLVPVLKDGDFAVAESNAILRYLAVTQPGGEAFYPDDPKLRATIDMWMDFGSSSMFREFMQVFVGVVKTPPKERKMGQIGIASRRFQMHTLKIGQTLDEQAFITGNKLTLADIATGVYMFRFYSLPLIKRQSQGRVEAWFTRLHKRPAYVENVEPDFRHMFVGAQ